MELLLRIPKHVSRAWLQANGDLISDDNGHEVYTAIGYIGLWICELVNGEWTIRRELEPDAEQVQA